jgi:aspartate aminotransferase-like enzyme
MPRQNLFDRYENTSTGISDSDVKTIRSMIGRFNLHTKEFHQYYDETKEMLKKIFQTKNQIIGLTGSIRIGFDAIFNNILEPADKVLILTNGYWGNHIPKVVNSYRGKSIVYEENHKLPINVEKVRGILRKNNDVKAVAVVHVETDTGIVNKVSEIGEIVKKESDALYIVDCATSLGGMEVRVDDWGADFCFSGSHKCMTAPVGLAFLTVSENAWNVIQNRKIPVYGVYNNLIPWRGPQELECEPPLPTMTLHAVRATLEWILSVGLKEVYKLHELAALALRIGLIELGLEIFPDCSNCEGCNSEKRFCSDVVTTVPYPPKVDHNDVERIMGERYHLSLTRTPYRPDTFQLGTINEWQISQEYILKFLTTLGLTFSELGVKINLDNGIKKAYEILRQQKPI